MDLHKSSALLTRRRFMSMIGSTVAFSVLPNGCAFYRKEKAMSKPITDFYSDHGRMSDPGKHLHLYEVLPSDVAPLTQIIQGLLLHRSYATFHGVTDAELSGRRNEEQIYTVESLLDLLLNLDPAPLTDRRNASRRAFVNCRHFALLLCSFLRHNAVPARIRVGFMRYGTPEAWSMYYSHYITEYWDPLGRQWIRTDSQCRVPSKMRLASQAEWD